MTEKNEASSSAKATSDSKRQYGTWKFGKHSPLDMIIVLEESMRGAGLSLSSINPANVSIEVVYRPEASKYAGSRMGDEITAIKVIYLEEG